jgi:hypothetical protein
MARQRREWYEETTKDEGMWAFKNCTGTRAWLFGIAVALLLYFSGMEKATEFSDDLKQGYKPAHGIAALLGFTSE